MRMPAWRWHYNRIKSYIGRPRLLVQERAIAVDEGDRCEHPLFIAGVHRSGTSLVRRMFNSHPDIACPPETFFLPYYLRMMEDPDAIAGYESFGHDRETMRADLARKASSLHETFRIAQGKSIWADKTPEYVFHLDAIDRLFASSPRYALVLRHPADIVYSIYKRGWRLNEIEDRFEAAVTHVRKGIDHMLAFERTHPERCTRIDYRLLCENPAAELRGAMARIGLEFDPEMLDFADKNHNYGTEDPVVRGKKTIDMSGGAWKSLDAAQQARLADAFGRRALEDIYW